MRGTIAAMTSSLASAKGAALIAALLGGMPGCKESQPHSASSTNAAVESIAPSTPAQYDEAAWLRLKMEMEAMQDRERWLTVETARNGTAGAWATGSFDRERNKLDIQTKDVQRFVIDVGRVPIDWEKLVVLRIDGKSHELRRREQHRYHFVLDRYGQWVVE